MGELRTTLGPLLAAAVLGVSVPAGAAAATELGQVQPAGGLLACEGSFSAAQVSTSEGAEYEVPAGGGVITSWRHRVGVLGSIAARLQMWRSVGDFNYTLVARSELESFGSGGVKEFMTRIPVAGGEFLGVRTVGDPTACISDEIYAPQDIVVVDDSADPGPGQTVDVVVGDERRVNVAATLEPDADSDGFGDETQDVAPALALGKRVKAKRSGFPVMVSCGPVACDAELTGTAVAAKGRGGSKTRRAAVAKKGGKRKFKLKPTAVSVAAGSEAAAKPKLERAKKSTRNLRKLLKSKRARKRSKLKLSLTATSMLGDTETVQGKAKLKP